MLSRTFITLGVSLCLEIWLSVLLYRRRVYKLAPVFFGYIVISVPVSLARLLTIKHYDVYFFVYWASELLLILLSLSALNQVFWFTYEDVHFLWWFRWLYYGAILLALGITIRMAIVSPPVAAHPGISFIVDAEITANMVRAGIVALFAAMIGPMAVDFQRYPFGIILGFGASSIGPCIAYFTFSVFGTKAGKFTALMSSLSYIVAPPSSRNGRRSASIWRYIFAWIFPGTAICCKVGLGVNVGTMRGHIRQKSGKGYGNSISPLCTPAPPLLPCAFGCVSGYFA